MSQKQPLKCTFIHSPDPQYADNQNYGAKFMPIWAYTLASHIPNNQRFKTHLCDLQFDEKESVPESDVFLFSGINQDCGSLVSLWAYLKKRYPKSISVIGGPIAWSFDKGGALGQLDPFDFVCIGDGELLIQDVLEGLYNKNLSERVIRSKKRFDISKAKPLNRELIADSVSKYYGSVIEVSRGCPFLCEFCDIRIMTDNNRSHCKSPNLIVEELNFLCNQGVKQTLFACDNFIGDHGWAEKVLDAMIEWRKQTGHAPAVYTWCTINLFRMPNIMKKMRLAGFDMLFIGIESFNTNSLCETAKVQNTAGVMIEGIRQIQSYGFIIVAGLIFGFDSEDESCFDGTIKGLSDSALLSGDPSFLTALPGTPLYRRMKLSGRLRQVRFGLGGFKYQTNIQYLIPQKKLIGGFQKFVNELSDGAHQYKRLKGYYELLSQGNFVRAKEQGFGNMKLYFKMVITNWSAIKQMNRRFLLFVSKPSAVYFGIKGFFLALRVKNKIPESIRYFIFWFFTWTNVIIKYRHISPDDFDLESVPEDFDIRKILPENYGSSADEPIPQHKISSQVKATTKQLTAFIEERLKISS